MLMYKKKENKTKRLLKISDSFFFVPYEPHDICIHCRHYCNIVS